MRREFAGSGLGFGRAFARQAAFAFTFRGIAEGFVKRAVRPFCGVCEDAVDEVLRLRLELLKRETPDQIFRACE